MKKIILCLGILISLDGVCAMDSASFETVKQDFLQGRVISVVGNITDFYGKTVSILKELQSDCKWRPSGAIDDVSAKQSAANVIGQFIDDLIRDKKYTDAEKWLEVEAAFTQDTESVARHTILINTLKKPVMSSMQPFGFSPFFDSSSSTPWGDTPFLSIVQ